MDDTTTIKKIGELKFFTPVVVNDASFTVGIYYDELGNKLVNAIDFLTEVGIRKNYIDEKIYQYIDKLHLKDNDDYIIKPSTDPLLSKPEYIFPLATAQKIAAIIEGDIGKATAQFFDLVDGWVEQDILRYVTFDTLFHSPVFSLDVIAYLFHKVGYNNWSVSEANIEQMLKKDRFLTKALRPTKGNEMAFLRYNNTTYATPYGLTMLYRRYLGMSNDVAITAVLESMPWALRKVSSSLFDDSKINKMVPVDNDNPNQRTTTNHA